MIWPCYLINLKENEQRLLNSQKQFLDLGLHHLTIEAVNGWDLSLKEIDKVYDREKNKSLYKVPLVPSEIGCYLSHFEAWGRIANGDEQGGFIFEDDFKANKELVYALKALSEDSVNDWDMVKLFSLDQNPKILRGREISKTLKIVQPNKIPTCMIGYALTKKGACELLSKPLSIYRPVDEDIKYFWETGLRVSLLIPQPLKIGDQSTVTTTIGADRKKANRRASLLNFKKMWRCLFYRVRYELLLFFHNKFR